jgi:predicted kinase
VTTGGLFVVLSGPPASGKSKLAPPLARALGLPLVAKDTVKDALMSVLPVPDVEASRRLGRPQSRPCSPWPASPRSAR